MKASDKIKKEIKLSDKQADTFKKRKITKNAKAYGILKDKIIIHNNCL